MHVKTNEITKNDPFFLHKVVWNLTFFIFTMNILSTLRKRASYKRNLNHLQNLTMQVAGWYENRCYGKRGTIWGHPSTTFFVCSEETQCRISITLGQLYIVPCKKWMEPLLITLFYSEEYLLDKIWRHIFHLIKRVALNSDLKLNV